MKDDWAVSAQNWHNITAPLRPSAGELALITRYLQSFGSGPESQVLVLGATPEYWHLPWPESACVKAVDSSPAMLEKVWPGPDNTAFHGDWCQLPLAGNSQDMVLLDAGLCLLPWPADQARVVHEIARVLKPGGLCIIRLLVLPASPQSPAQVYAAVRAGQVPDLSHLRLQLWMATQASTGKAATNQDIWWGMKTEFGSWSELATYLNYDPAHLEQFGERRLTLTFPIFEFATLADYELLFCGPPKAFCLEEIFWPDYPLGDRCPTLVLRKT